MTRDSHALLNRINLIIEDNIDKFTNEFLISKKKHDFSLDLSAEEMQTLLRLNLSQKEIELIRKSVLSTARLIIFGILCEIDGVSLLSIDQEDMQVPPIALINRDTGKEIGDEFYHDEICDYWDKD